MPFIELITNESITEEKEKTLKAGIALAIGEALGKPESYLMINFASDSHLWFRGENSAPAIFVRVNVLGQSDEAAYAAFSEKLMLLLTSELSVPSGNIFIKIDDSSSWYF